MDKLTKKLKAFYGEIDLVVFMRSMVKHWKVFLVTMLAVLVFTAVVQEFKAVRRPIMSQVAMTMEFPCSGVDFNDGKLTYWQGYEDILAEFYQDVGEDPKLKMEPLGHSGWVKVSIVTPSDKSKVAQDKLNKFF